MPPAVYDAHHYQDLEAHDPARIAATLGVPTLVPQGGRDYQVTVEDFLQWQRALAGKANACLKVFDDLDHLFRKGTGPSSPADYDVHAPVEPAVIDCIATWIKSGSCCE